MILTKKYITLAFLTVSSISTNNASLSQLSTYEKAELAAAFTRAAAGVTNAYVLQDNSARKIPAEIGAKVASIIHDALNIYNISNKGEKNIHQIFRLLHDNASLFYEIKKMSKNSSIQGVSSYSLGEDYRKTIAILHYALPLLEGSAGTYIVTTSADNSAAARKHRALAQGILSLAHYIDDALKSDDDILVLYPRLTLTLASLVRLGYDLCLDTVRFEKQITAPDNHENEQDSNNEQDASELPDQTTSNQQTYEQELEEFDRLANNIKFIGRVTRSVDERLFNPSQHKHLIELVADIREFACSEDFAGKSDFILTITARLLSDNNKPCLDVQALVKQLYRSLYELSTADVMQRRPDLSQNTHRFINNLNTLLQERYAA